MFAAPAARAATFVSASHVSDLACPNAPPPQPVRPPALAHAPPPNTLMPTQAELGALAIPARREPPVLDLAKLPAFALRDGTQPRARRIAVWGDSHIAAGPFMAELSGAIAAHGETVGTRFLPPTMGRANVRLPTLHAYCIGTGWSTALAFTAPAPLATGPALTNRVAAAGPESYLWLDFRDGHGESDLKRLQLVYRPLADAAVTVSVNDGPEEVLALPGGNGSALATIEADAPIATVKLRVSAGQVVLEGFLLDRIAPPLVTFDVFGLPSSTVRGWANADPAAIGDALHGESYDAVALEYGTNEGSDPNFDAAKYAGLLNKALTNLRSVFPGASCLLVGPPDRGVLLARRGETGTDYLRFARIHRRIAQAQAEIGARFGCVAWDWQDYMGGPGGSYGWAFSDPVLIGGDLTHMTMRGYRRTGQALAKSLGWTDDLYPR